MASPVLDVTTNPDPEEREVNWARWVRLGLIALVVLIVAGLAYAIISDQRESAATESWDQMAQLRSDLEPEGDDIWLGMKGTSDATRLRYIGALQTFLEKKAGEIDPALEGQARWHLARTLANHLLSSTELLDASKRDPHYARAIRELETIRDRLRDHPLNWTRWADNRVGQATLTRQFLEFLDRNRAWEKEHFPKDKAPDGTETLVFRTTRGDVRMQLYVTDAPDGGKLLRDRVLSGAYDGSAFFMREGRAAARDLTKTWTRLGHLEIRDPKPYERDQHLPYGRDTERRGRVPEESRNRIVHERGVVSAWHAPTTETDGSAYDDPEDLIFVTRRSPELDYEFTPLGRVTDAASLAVLDAIFDSKTWNEDTDTRDDAEARFVDILDVFQVPVVVVKALVYGADGALVKPAADAAVPTRVAPTDAEASLASLKADAYKVDVPQRPAAPPPVVPDDVDAPDGGADDAATPPGDEGDDAGDEPADEGDDAGE